MGPGLRRALGAAVFFFLVLVSACQRSTRDVPSTPPSLTGVITRIDAQGENSAEILVEENPEETSGSPKARIHVTKSTLIVTRTAHLRLSAADLRTGQKVSAWYTGPVLESYPVQAGASVVMLDQAPVEALPGAGASRPPGSPGGSATPGGSTTPPGGSATPPGGSTTEPPGAEETPPDETTEPPPEESAPPTPATDGTDWTAGIVDRPGRAPGVAVLRAVREASHPDFDRVVFEFGGAGVPHAHIEYVDRPVRQCGSGEPVPVAGDAWLEVRFDPSQAHDDAGRPTVTSRNRHPGFPLVEQIILTCDFEGYVTWVLGVKSPHKFLVRELSDPSRLVLDIRH